MTLISVSVAKLLSLLCSRPCNVESSEIIYVAKDHSVDTKVLVSVLVLVRISLLLSTDLYTGIFKLGLLHCLTVEAVRGHQPITMQTPGDKIVAAIRVIQIKTDSKGLILFKFYHC